MSTPDPKDGATFDDFWNAWTECPRCLTSDSVRLAASNAWHQQQARIDDLVSKTANVCEAFGKKLTENQELQAEIARLNQKYDMQELVKRCERYENQLKEIAKPNGDGTLSASAVMARWALFGSEQSE